MLESVVGNRTHDPHRQVPSKRSLSLRAAALAVGITVSGLAGAAYAAPMTYRFEVLDAQVRPSRDTTDLRVRLVRQADGQPVTGAALDDVRLGMWPIQLHKAPCPLDATRGWSGGGGRQRRLPPSSRLLDDGQLPPYPLGARARRGGTGAEHRHRSRRLPVTR
ncbi:hypothetical protein ACFQY5_33230 [Paeniroseomonas aquatica]|uniref:hypothetical protein n=1 Tax=Paeniroseomonas aquatica TaxID=373043 RepID=UPI0036240A06